MLGADRGQRQAGLTPQQMLDALLAKIERDGIESVAETMSAE